MSKNIFDYIKMGLRSERKIETIEAEKMQKEKKDAQAFNKAFTDKTYTVAKKMIENVEKVADYDYEGFFSRVNKVIDDKKNVKRDVNVDRDKRSKEFDERIKNHPSKFDINDYPKSQTNYKNSIIDKTKKNIQKKIDEAESRSKVLGNSPPPLVMKVNGKTVSGINQRKANIIKMSSEDDELIHNDSDVKPNLSELSVTSEVSTSDVLKNDKSEYENQVIKPDFIEAKPTDDDLVNEAPINEEPVNEKSVNEEPVNEEPINEEPVNEEPTNEDLVDEEPVCIEDESSYDSKYNDQEDNSHQEVYTNTATTITEKTFKNSRPNIEFKTIVTDETVVTTTIPDGINESDDNQDPNTEDFQDKDDDTKSFKEDYTKEEQVKNKKYYKQKRREKFARRMNVELEDNLIVKKKRSITRLFKFSLSFKLSFVFVLLLIFTVVALSVAFYFGIDYVIELKDAGKLEDIQFFKDILIVLLIIFDSMAILLCISIGTKTSRELVSPLNEMTMIVQQISAKEMERRLNVKGMHDELKELAITFNDMLDRIENSYETQNRFTSDASHELRTPIAVIQGYINMLDRWGKADGEILDESIEAIKSESKNMKRLTEKLLLLAKADKGILELDFQPFSLKDLISEITRETEMIDHSHTVGNKINDVELIKADRESLKQAIRIFVDNSVKYTPEGGVVEINSYFSKKKIYIEIADNGIGIAKEDMDNIFNRFYRVDKSRTKESGGHGLGLSIAKWIVNQHKGEIEVKSEINKGTTITIILSPIG